MSVIDERAGTLIGLFRNLLEYDGMRIRQPLMWRTASLGWIRGHVMERRPLPDRIDNAALDASTAMPRECPDSKRKDHG